MNPRLTLATADRVLRQIRHDPRTVVLLIVVPCVLIGLLAWVYEGTPVFDQIGAPLLGVFPFVVMFLVTSVATLRERQSGTLERLLTMPLGKGDLIGGYAQANGFASPGGIREDEPSLYGSVAALPLNQWSLTGAWTIGGEFATLNDKTGSIAHRFHARDLHLVLAPATPGHAIRFRVKIDGAAPGPDHGFDVDAEGWGTVQEDRLYQLVRQTGPVTDRTFEIEFFDAGVRAYAFTFG